MAAKNDNFFENLDEEHEHSKAKHFIYRRYLDAFVRIILKSNLEVIIFDGFAGKGIYQSKSNPNEIDKDYIGSPLLALNSSIDYLIKNKKCEVKLIFVEKNETNYDQLCVNIKKTIGNYKLEGFTYNNTNKLFTVKNNSDNINFDLEVHNDEFQNQIENVIECHEKSSNGRLLSIVDPFGYKDLSTELMSKLVGTNKEIIVTLMANHMNQYKNSLKHKENIANVLRVEDKEEIKNIRSELDLAILFGENLKKSGDSSNSNINPIYFKIRNNKNRTSFILVFISSNRKGFFEMKKTFYYKTNNRKNNQEIMSLNDYEFSQYIKDQNKEILLKDNNNNNKEVAGLLIEKFKSRKEVTINKIRDFIEDETPYINFKKSLTLLEKNNIIDVKCNDKNFKRKKNTYPDHKKFLIDFSDRCLQNENEIRSDDEPETKKSRANY